MSYRDVLLCCSAGDIGGLGVINDPTNLLNKMEENDLHLERLPYKGEYRREVFANANRFDDYSATHFIIQGHQVIWIGELSYIESWVNAHF